MTDSTFDKKLVKIEWLPLSQLSVVWQQSQRPPDEKFAQSIADDFDADKFGVLAVTKPNGEGIYHIIDGQNRKRGAEIFVGGDLTQKVPCQVLNAHDPARAAELFDEINSNRKAQKAIDFFKVRVTARYEDHVKVDQIVRDNGYFVGNNSGDSNKGIACVNALLYIKRSYGDEVLDATLKVLHAAWGFDRGAQIGPIVQGIGMFLSEFRLKANWQQIIASLRKKTTPGQLIAHAKNYREIHGGTLATAIRSLLITTYNRGCPQGKRLKDDDNGNGNGSGNGSDKHK